MTGMDLDSTSELANVVLVRGASPELEWVEIDGECIVWCQPTEQLHRLDRIASLVFRLCDGSATVAETVDELASSFGEDRARVAADVEPCVRFLLAAELVASSP